MCKQPGRKWIANATTHATKLAAHICARDSQVQLPTSSDLSSAPYTPSWYAGHPCPSLYSNKLAAVCNEHTHASMWLGKHIMTAVASGASLPSSVAVESHAHTKHQMHAVCNAALYVAAVGAHVVLVAIAHTMWPCTCPLPCGTNVAWYALLLSWHASCTVGGVSMCAMQHHMGWCA